MNFDHSRMGPQIPSSRQGSEQQNALKPLSWCNQKLEGMLKAIQLVILIVQVYETMVAFYSYSAMTVL